MDEDHQVPVLFEIDLIEEGQKFPDDPEFEIQAAQILADLLDKMTFRRHEIVNSIS